MVKFPYEIREVVDPEGKECVQHWIGLRGGAVPVGPFKYLYPRSFGRHAEIMYNTEVKDDDIWLLGFSKSGLPWVRDLVWLLTNNLDLSFANGTKRNLNGQVEVLEIFSMANDDILNQLMELNKDASEKVNTTFSYCLRPESLPERLQASPSPRRIQSSLPLSLLPPELLTTAKVIYIARHPKDVAINSYYYFSALTMYGYEGSFEKYWELFQTGWVPYGSQMQHVKEAWDLREHKNLLFLFYEDLIQVEVSEQHCLTVLQPP